ncbi:MAG: tyrosine recombinase XerC [Burkholderiales bacterium]
MAKPRQPSRQLRRPVASAQSAPVAPRPTTSVTAETSAEPASTPELPPQAEDYLEHLQFERRLSPNTIDNYRRDLVDLVRFSQTRVVRELDKLDSQDIRRYLASAHARGMTPRALARMLSGWRGYFKFALRQGVGQINPCDGVHAPKAEKRLPRTLSPEEAIRLVSFDADDAAAQRDRAALELIYSCGLRISELTGLNLDSIDFHSREIRVLGKGSKTRIIPVGEPALAAVQRWLGARAAMKVVDTRALFVGAQGRRLSASVLQARIKQWAQRQGLEVNVHPHMLRHSFASHVLQSSQNLRAVQEMMGHASIASTQVYTHLDFQHLAKVYDSAHPRAKKK